MFPSDTLFHWFKKKWREHSRSICLCGDNNYHKGFNFSLSTCKTWIKVNTLCFFFFFFLFLFFFQKPWLGFANWRKKSQKWKVISLPIDSSVTIAYYHFSFFAVFKYEFYLFKTTVLLKPFFFLPYHFQICLLALESGFMFLFFFFFFLYHFLGTIATLESKVANLTGKVKEIRLPIPPGKINK